MLGLISIPWGKIIPVTVDYYMTLNSPWTYLGSALMERALRKSV
jgi:2-hydroxychromene-2-carboxylate isomerase